MSRYRCPVCGYVYDEALGVPREGFPAGTPWPEVPDDWCCPDCGVREKIDFVPEEPGSASQGSGSVAEEPCARQEEGTRP